MVAPMAAPEKPRQKQQQEQQQEQPEHKKRAALKDLFSSWDQTRRGRRPRESDFGLSYKALDAHGQPLDDDNDPLLEALKKGER